MSARPIPPTDEAPDPGDAAAWAPDPYGDPARQARPGPLVSLYVGHPSLPPGYDPFGDTHDARMPRDEGD